MVDKSGTRVVKTVCAMCMQCCGINAHTRGGRLVKVTGMEEHPYNHLCVKSQAIVDWLYSPDRITFPMRRVNGNWKKISWDEALDIVSTGLGEVKEKHGAKSAVVHVGNPFIGTQVGRVASRFCSVYGTPNYTSTATLCWAAGGIGHGLTIGDRLQRLVPSYEGTRCVIVWGINPQMSNIIENAAILDARKRGARLVVIDPRKTPMAMDADIHAAIKPGTDCALALGVINVIISEKLYDSDFVEKWTLGLDGLAKHAARYTPEEVEKLTWVPADTVREIARMYAGNRPVAITQGVAIDHSVNGVQTSRALAILMTITGNLDVTGGNVYNQPLRLASMRIKGGASPEDGVGVRYPVFARLVGEQSAASVTDAILTGKPYPVRAAVIHGGNPVLTWPDSSRVKEAFGKLELLAVSDLFLTETAKLAHVFLPATTFWEGEVLKDYAFIGLPLAVIGSKVVEPLGECRENWRVWADLGRKMGYGEFFPWQTAEDLISFLLEPSGHTMAQLKKQPGGMMYGNPGGGEKYLEKGFSTASGKIEFESETMKKYGYPALPSFAPSQADDPAYPLILISGTRVHAFTHSRHRHVERLRKLIPYPTVDINADAARSLGIADGDQVTVESPKGSVTLKAITTDYIHPRVISITHGWDEANVNNLTDGAALDPVSGYPAFKDVRCRVLKRQQK